MQYFIMSNNKTVPLHYYRPIRKSFLQTCEQADFSIKTQTIKIPFINTLPQGLDTITPQDKPKQNNKIHETPQQNKQEKKRNQILSRLSAKEKSTDFKFTFISKEYFSSNNSVVKTSKFTSNNMNKLEKHKSEIQNRPNKEQSQIQKNDEKSSSVHKQLSLPAIKFKNLKDSNRKQSIKRFFKREKQQIATRMKKLKSCYGMQVVTVKNNSSIQSERRRIKTQQQIQNEFILERILTMKPSKQLRRDSLDLDFKKHQYYKQVRERKNSHRSPNQKSLMRRSKTVNMTDF